MKAKLGGRTWAALLTFGLVGQIAWVIENMYFNVFLYNTISGDTSMIAAMVAWSAVTATVTTLVMGALSDRLGRRKAFIVAGYLLWGVSIGAFALIKSSPVAAAAHSAAVLVVVLDCVMTFFGSTANDAAFNAWVTDVTVPENRGRVETVLAIMPLVAMLVVFGALDGLTQAGSWRLFFLIVGGVTGLGGVLGCFFIREPDLPRGQGTTFSNILYGFRPAVVRDNPRLYLSLAALGVYCMSQQVYMPYLIIYIQRFLGITDYTFLLAGVLIVSSVLSVLAGRPIDRLGKLRCLIPAGIVGFAGLVLMYFARSQWFVLAAGIVMLGGGMVISACCNGLIRDYTPAGKAGLFQGIRIVFQVLLPMVTGPYIGAAVIRGTGMTYEDLGTIKQVPTAEIFLAAAAALVLATAATLATGAFAAEDDGVVAGYMPPQEVMVQDDVALHSADVAVGEVDPNYGGYAAPEGNPIQGNIMLISAGDLGTPLPSDTQAEKAQAHYTVKGLLGKQVLYTARQEGSVLTLDFPENVATFRATILDLQTLMNDGVSTVVLQTNKTSTTLNLTLLCDGYSANDKVVLRHIGSRACLTVKGRSRRDLLIGR